MSQHLAKHIIKTATPVVKEVTKATIGFAVGLTAIVVSKNKEDRKQWIDEWKGKFGL